MLSIAFYLILEDNNPLYRFEKWHLTHKHPYGENITSPRSSEFLASITDAQIQKFFKLQARRRVEEKYWAYDSTSIPSHSELLKLVQDGKNKEDDRLPQLNLLLVFGEKLSWVLEKQSLSWIAASTQRIASMDFIVSI